MATLCCSSDLEARFGLAAHGVRWAASQIPGYRCDETGCKVDHRVLTLSAPKNKKDASDNFEIKYSKTEISVQSATVTGLIGGLLEVARQLTAGAEKNMQQELQFKTRLYKREGCLEAEHLESFFQELARRHFNAVVVYLGQHPFESFLDYEGKPHYCNSDPAARKRNFDRLTRFYETAHKYGIKTFLHHYVSHFTQALADHLQLGLKESRSTRLANYDHPEVDEYCRYVYRRTFETMPCLDGLFLNFESCGNSINLLKKTLFAVTAEMKKKPMLVFRLWGLSDVEGMAQLIKAYPGPKALKHKPHESNDVYYYPVCDDRVKVWKKALPDVEFFFSNGPCHNCGTNISQKLWTDPEYIRQLLQNFQDKGADSITFQTVHDLLIPCLPSAEAFSEVNRAMSKINHGHLEAVVDFVRGKMASPQEWATRIAKRFATTEKAGAAIFKATVESSRIILKMYQQFCYGSPQEGYLYPGRFSHYQEPFFYYPMSFLNRIGEIANVSWHSWAIRDTKIKVLPDDTQAPIDYVNPAVKKKAARNPHVIVKEIEGHLKEAQKALALYKKEAGKDADLFFIEKVELNCLNGERIRREILIAIELCSCYFAKTKATFFKHLKNARALMLESAKVLGEKIKATDGYCPTTSTSPYAPAQDAAALEKILQYEKENVPFEALQCYLRSHERYNEIRRLFRPYAGMTDAVKVRNQTLLEDALNAALEAVSLLEDKKYGLYRDNVAAWVNYLWAELEWLTPPTMACPNENSIAPNEGFRSMVHDQCYRWGEFCWEDFSSFYRRQNFFRDEVCDCRAVATDKGLKLTLREHGIDWKEREAVWDKNRGTINQTGFMQILIDPTRDGSKLCSYTLYFKGEGGTRRVGADKITLLKDCDVAFQHTDSNWRFDLVIPWTQLGKKPAAGEIWRLNIFSNPPVVRNHRVIWSQGYESNGDVARLGNIVFV